MSDRPASPEASDWTGIAFGLCVALLAAYQQFKLPPVLPEMLDRFDYGTELAGGFMSVFAAIGLLLSYQIGRLMQVQSTAAWLVGACVLIALGAGPILALPENGWAVLAGRALEGTAMAVLAVAGPTLMTRNAAPRHLPFAAALAATWVPLGGLIATVIARAAEEWLPAGAPVWPSVWWMGLIFAAAMAGWTLLLARGGGERIALPTARGGAPALSAADRKALTLLTVCFGLWALQNISVLSWLPEYLVDARGLADARAKELYGLTVIAIAAANLFAAVLLRSGIPIAVLLALVLAGQGVVLALGPLAGGDWTGIAVLLAYGFFAGITPTCIFGLPGALLGGGAAGPAAFGLMMTGRNLGILIGPVLVGWIGAGVLGWTVGWWLAAASAFCGMLAAISIVVQTRRKKSLPLEGEG
jgi:predicted MFS family arabinose efflux permease